MSAAASTTGPAVHNRGLIVVSIMLATIMQALDTTIANVALPYMQGSLSASLDQINWVLTSYILAAAIMTAPIAWIAGRFGRKRLFIVCVVGFTVASATRTPTRKPISFQCQWQKRERPTYWRSCWTMLASAPPAPSVVPAKPQMRSVWPPAV